MRGEIDRERYLAGMKSPLTAIGDDRKLDPVTAPLSEARLRWREVGAPLARSERPAVPTTLAQMREK